MVSQEPAKLSYVHAQSGFESRWLRQEQRSTICLVMYSVGKGITPKWRSRARVGDPDAQEAHPVHHARAEDSIFRRFMNNKSSPARGRKRMTQCAGMRLKNSTRTWKSKHNWYCLGLENRSSARVCRFESCLFRQHPYPFNIDFIGKVRYVMSYPTNCCNCQFRNRCDAAMYTDKCHFFGPNDKPKRFSFKRFFSSFFA